MGGSRPWSSTSPTCTTPCRAAIGDRECIVWRDRRLTYGDVADRTNRLANHLIAAGPRRAHRASRRSTGTRAGRTTSRCYLHNGNEYLEAMLGAYKARVAPFNVNYRYVAEELRYLLNDAGRQGHRVPLRVRRPPGRGAARPPGARPCCSRSTTAPAPTSCPARRGTRTRWPRASPERPTSTGARTTSTSSTPAAPRACPRACCGGRPTSSSAPSAAGTSGPAASSRAWSRSWRPPGTAARASLPAPPFMHGAGHWLAFNAINGGSTICIQDDTVGLDPDDIWRTIEREKVNILLIVGDAFGRPLVDQLEAQAAVGQALRPVLDAHGDLGRRAAELDPEGPLPRPAARRSW